MPSLLLCKETATVNNGMINRGRYAMLESVKQRYKTKNKRSCAINNMDEYSSLTPIPAAAIIALTEFRSGIVT